MDNFQTWDTAWYHHEPLTPVWVIVILATIIITGLTIYRVSEHRVSWGAQMSLVIFISLFVGVAFAAIVIAANISQSNQRTEHYENAVSEIENQYGVTLLEQRESPGSIPPQVDPQDLLDDLDNGDYEAVSVFTDNELLPLTAYVHRNDNDQLLLMVEVPEHEEDVVEYEAELHES